MKICQRRRIFVCYGRCSPIPTRSSPHERSRASPRRPPASSPGSRMGCEAAEWTHRSPQEAAHFLNKLLFCLFAEDIKLLPEGLFTRVVTRGLKRPETFNQNISGLFEAMSTGGEFSL